MGKKFEALKKTSESLFSWAEKSDEEIIAQIRSELRTWNSLKSRLLEPFTGAIRSAEDATITGFLWGLIVAPIFFLALYILSIL